MGWEDYHLPAFSDGRVRYGASDRSCGSATNARRPWLTCSPARAAAGCGGSCGYEHLREVLVDPTSDEYEDMLAWLGLDKGPTSTPTGSTRTASIGPWGMAGLRG